MPEAEDVLLEAAERASAAVRAAWERHRGAPRRGERPPASALHRRLAAWQAAWLGRSWPVAGTAARPAPGRLARRLRGLPPWTARGDATPFTDGHGIWLPRAWMEAPAPEGHPDRALLTTLGLAWRLARGRAVPASGPPLARDLGWLAEGALADAALVRAWPGLAPSLATLRREAIASRPEPARLRPAERALEAWLGALLAAPPGTLPPTLLGGLAPEADPADVAAFAAARAAALAGGAAGYRGVAPVTHWGVPHPAAAPPRDHPSAPASSPGERPRRGAKLPRPLLRREADPEEDARPGPFVLPFSDPHLTVDDPAGLARPPDRGHDEDLDTLAEELARLEGLPVVRHDVPVREFLEDGAAASSARPPDAASPAAGGLVWLYPEWDAARGAYRDPGCRVREVAAAGDDGGWSQAALAARGALLARLRRQLEGLRPRRQRLRRQLDGDDVDVSGWVDDWADHRAGHASAGRVYTKEQTRRRDVAVTLLLDASGSTESWLSGSQRVIDVVKEAALAFGEALATLGDRFALQAFSGQGAADVRVRVLKRFEEPPGVAVQRRIGALEPDAFTRLGGALRHAVAGLARQPARARLLLVLSDGKPQDEDGYEGSYGIEDVRQAVSEARLQGVRVFGITVDREGPVYLPRLFGPHAYTVIWNAEALPERLPAIYRRLTAGA